MRIWTKETDEIFFEMWDHCKPDEIATIVNGLLSSNAKSKGYDFVPVTTARGVRYHALKHGLILQSDVEAFAKRQKREHAKRQYISAKVFQVVLERDDHKGLLCGNQIDLRVVHIKPVSRGGNNDPETCRHFVLPVIKTLDHRVLIFVNPIQSCGVKTARGSFTKILNKQPRT